ncbi:MAG: proton extrusion protein PcxA [Microcoleaceae cyanobacterium]
MIISTWTQVRRFWRTSNRWFRGTPERALEQAYDAASKIKALENEHFNGKKIGDESFQYSDRIKSYFNAELKKHLGVIQARLAEFNASRSMVGLPEQVNPADLNGKVTFDGISSQTEQPQQIFVVCGKLDYIDSVVSRYTPNSTVSSKVSETTTTAIATQVDLTKIAQPKVGSSVPSKKTVNLNKTLQDDLTSGSDTSFLPRSLLRTIGRIQRELNPESEEEVLKNYRKSKIKTVISVRFILLLILVPLLTQQLAKNFVIGPIIDHVLKADQSPIFLNIDMEEKAFMELHRYEERLKFQQMIGTSPKLTGEEFEEEVKQKANELAEKYRMTGSGAIENVFADLLSIAAFGIIIYTNKQEVEILKSFLGDLIYGLSDSAKAFIIILLTDMFVGFHSPHGWEVILESISRHFGLPENRDFNFLFIATFPVILDAVFKYWIFRYLNRSSPSAVSTYKTMNE